jgi:cyclopropane fatty-acyl-phospholipid synthase-like methyltransferase
LKPYAESCIQNQDVILKQLQTLCPDPASVLEIGSGTGQHAVHFATHLPHLDWYTSDRLENHSAIKLWLDESQLSNAHYPIELDVKQVKWPELAIDIVFSANTAHIMSQLEVESFFSGVGKQLNKNGLFILYGPFNYNGLYTADSNQHFDNWLKQRDPQSGIKDFGFLNSIAEQAGLILNQQIEMPANNKILCWKKPNNNSIIN